MVTRTNKTSATTSRNKSDPKRDPDNQSRLLNRELSLIKFNERVLAMAERADTPALERLRYICIVSSNLDEFFEIRVSSLKEQLRQYPNAAGADGLSAEQAFERVQQAVHQLVQRQYDLLEDAVWPALKAEGILVHHAFDWNAAQTKWAHEVFTRDVMPLLTPIGLDPAHPFPRVYNKSLNFILPFSFTHVWVRVEMKKTCILSPPISISARKICSFFSVTFCQGSTFPFFTQRVACLGFTKIKNAIFLAGRFFHTTLQGRVEVTIGTE